MYPSQLDHLVFQTIGGAADDAGLPCYVVGGWVRDRLLDRGNSKDVDFVVVGDALALAQESARRLKAGKVTVFKNYGTAQFRWKDWDIEFVRARSESYSPHSRNPKVAPGDTKRTYHFGTTPHVCRQSI